MLFDPAISCALRGYLRRTGGGGGGARSLRRLEVQLPHVALGVVAVFVPMFVLGVLITLFPDVYAEARGWRIAALTSASDSSRVLVSQSIRVLRRTLRERHHDHGLLGAIEAFRGSHRSRSILPTTSNPISDANRRGHSRDVTSKESVRKVKQANMKVVVSALLLSFACSWRGFPLSD